jgi:hypothetical protein
MIKLNLLNIFSSKFNIILFYFILYTLLYNMSTDSNRELIINNKEISKCKENIELFKNVKNKNLSMTEYGNSPYSKLWYVDNKNKICITFSPRGGCSIAFQLFLDLVGLLKDGIEYNSFIHYYRLEIFNKCISKKKISDLVKQKYTFIKFIINPYIRAVSIYRAQNSHLLSFREYLKQLINNEIDYFNSNDKGHLHPQYIKGEEKIITKYIKINENEKHTIKLNDGSLYELDVNKYTSIHHGVRTHNTQFCGDLPRNIINGNLPQSYKYFYDDEIKSMVDKYYKDDIEKYGFSFEDF